MAIAVVFDMDGVIVDSEYHWRQVEGNFLRNLIPTWSAEDQSKILGVSIYEVHKMLTKEYGLILSREDYIGHYESLAGELYGNRVQLLPGFLEVFSELRRRKVPCGVASSSPKAWIEIVINRFELSPELACYVSADDVGGVGKPDPAIYRFAAQQIGLDPRRCVAIEDSDKGLTSAHSAGMRTIGLRNGMNSEQTFVDADLEIARFSPQLVDQLVKLVQ